MQHNSPSILKKGSQFLPHIQPLSDHQPSMLNAWLIIISLIVIVLMLVNLAYAPRIWYDEGSHLHVPKTLIQDGVYADKSAEGYRFYGPTIGIGPTIMLPIAASFKLFGIGVAQGRIIIVMYGILAFILFFQFAKRSYGSLIAILALSLLAGSRTLSQEGFIEYSRQVLGEVPGLMFLCAGLLTWNMLLNRPKLREVGIGLPCLTGLFFGLAMLTKNQFTLILVPAFGLVVLADLVYFRAATWKIRLLPPLVAVACFGFLTILQYQFLGAGTFWETVQETRRAASGAIFVFNLGSSLKSLIYLIRPDLYGGLLIPGLVYAFWKLRQGGIRGLRDSLLVVIIAVWLVWYVSASLGWPRYAFPAVALGALTTARLLAELMSFLGKRGNIYRYAIIGFMFLIICIPLFKTGTFVTQPDDSAQRFAQVVDQQVPLDASIATWEQEMAILTNHNYRYPAQSLLNDAVKHEWFAGPAAHYDWMENPSEYVIIGPFAKYTLIASDTDFHKNYRLVDTTGPYDLYQRIHGNG